MFRRENNKLNIPKINESVNLLSKILKISYFLIIVIGIYAVTLISKEWGVVRVIGTFLKILVPFFIGFVIAWLFNPLVTWLNKKKINRILGTVIVYIIFLGFLYLMLSSIFPLILEQANDLLSAIPGFIDKTKDFINNFFKNLSNSSFDYNGIKTEIFNYITTFGKNLSASLPSKIMLIITSLFSGVGTIALSLIIGFYMLFNFDNVKKTLIKLIPENIRETSTELLRRVNNTLVGYVQGTFFVAFIVFITSYIGFLILGVKAPLLFATFCGITDLIPYAGPFIGGTPVALITLAQNTTSGVLVIVYIVAVQWLESLVLQPVIMSKAMKLNPVTIIIGLLIFQHFFGILGMIIATPIIATLKVVIIFFNEKYNILKKKDEIDI